MKVIESTGRKLKDAIDNGLTQLGKSLTEVDVEVLDNGGLFRKAKVRITVHDDGTEETSAVSPAPAPAPAAPAPRPAEQRERKAERDRTERRERPIREEKREERKEIKPPVQRAEHPTEQSEHKEVRPPRHYDPVTPEVAKKAEDFVTELVSRMGVTAGIDTAIEEGELRIDLKAEGSALIGYHGEALDSIEYITSYIINRDTEKNYHVIVDCNNYREKRKESLVALANKMAAKCLKVRHKISLEPMNSADRKIIHSALADNDQVITRSEGHDPNRHVVILCKKR